ncbi:hypothetical protein Z043_117676, partial [Scleropages formosus]
MRRFRECRLGWKKWRHTAVFKFVQTNRLFEVGVREEALQRAGAHHLHANESPVNGLMDSHSSVTTVMPIVALPRYTWPRVWCKGNVRRMQGSPNSSPGDLGANGESLQGEGQGQLAAGTCEIVTLDRDSSQPRRTVARQTARCACRKGQIAGTTRARPACVD